MSIEQVQEKIAAGESPANIRKFIQSAFGVGRSRGNEIYSQILEETKAAKEAGAEPLEFVADKYCFNKEDDTYIFNLKCQSKPLVLSAAKVKAIFRSYSKWGENLTSTEVCRTYFLTPQIFDGLRRILNLTKNTEPLPAEDIFDNTVEDSVQSILEGKRFRVYQGYEKEKWKETQDDADKWRRFQSHSIDPFSRFLDSWNPPQYKKVPAPAGKAGKKWMLINVADIHVGAQASGEYLYRQRNWNHEELVKSMKNYALKVKDETSDRKSGFEAAYLTIGGDICHTLTGFTDGGTKLEHGGHLGEDQLDYAVTLLTAFINEMLAIFPKVYVKGVGGNHSHLGDWAVNTMLALYFRSEPRIEFEVTKKRYLPFKIENTLVILDHGASGRGIKSKLPRDGAAQSAYIQGILLDKPELLANVKSKLFLTNDKHHYRYIENNHFDLVVCPSIVAGDSYSDISGWGSRPSQCIFVLDEDGMKETIRLYFD